MLGKPLQQYSEKERSRTIGAGTVSFQFARRESRRALDIFLFGTAIFDAAKGYLPQFALSAKASYQSEVTEILETSKEIAEALSLTEGNVNVRLSRGRERLKRQLLQKGGDRYALCK